MKNANLKNLLANIRKLDLEPTYYDALDDVIYDFENFTRDFTYALQWRTFRDAVSDAGVDEDAADYETYLADAAQDKHINLLSSRFDADKFNEYLFDNFKEI